MGRAKKKLPVAPSKDSKGAPGGDANPNAAPVQRKRGRPRKTQIKEEVTAVDSDTKPDEHSKAKKFPKLTAETAGKNRSIGPGMKDNDASPTSDSDKVLESSNSSHVDEVVTVKRAGRRRKSEPHRAAGTFFDGR